MKYTLLLILLAGCTTSHLGQHSPDPKIVMGFHDSIITRDPDKYICADPLTLKCDRASAKWFCTCEQYAF